MLIETDRLIIRRFTYNDWKDLYEYLSDKQVVRYEPYDIFTEEDCKNEAAERSFSEAFLAVCLKDNNKLIGNIYFEQQKPKEYGNWEIGYVLNPKYHGNGYATEGCRAVMDYGFKKLKVRRIIAMCNPENVSSWRLLERLKMRREGHLCKNIYFKTNEKDEPVWIDTYEYAILANEWLS